MINQFLNLTKNSSLAIAVGYAELSALTLVLISQANPAPQMVADPHGDLPRHLHRDLGHRQRREPAPAAGGAVTATLEPPAARHLARAVGAGEPGPHARRRRPHRRRSAPCWRGRRTEACGSCSSPPTGRSCGATCGSSWSAGSRPTSSGGPGWRRTCWRRRSGCASAWPARWPRPTRAAVERRRARRGAPARRSDRACGGSGRSSLFVRGRCCRSSARRCPGLLLLGLVGAVVAARVAGPPTARAGPLAVGDRRGGGRRRPPGRGGGRRRGLGRLGRPAPHPVRHAWRGSCWRSRWGCSRPSVAGRACPPSGSCRSATSSCSAACRWWPSCSSASTSCCTPSRASSTRRASSSERCS